MFDGADPDTLLASFKAFGGTKGLYVASGDFTGDGLDDVIVGHGAGGRVRVFDVDAATPALVLDFLAFDGPTKGVRVAAIDVNDDQVPDILGTAARCWRWWLHKDQVNRRRGAAALSAAAA